MAKRYDGENTARDASLGIVAALKTIEPGGKVVYFRGTHCNDCAENVRAAAWALHVAGKAFLVQRRVSPPILWGQADRPHRRRRRVRIHRHRQQQGRMRQPARILVGRAARPGTPSASAVRPAGSDMRQGAQRRI